jgi:hypothetical protein
MGQTYTRGARDRIRLDCERLIGSPYVSPAQVRWAERVLDDTTALRRQPDDAGTLAVEGDSPYPTVTRSQEDPYSTTFTVDWSRLREPAEPAAVISAAWSEQRITADAIRNILSSLDDQQEEIIEAANAWENENWTPREP